MSIKNFLPPKNDKHDSGLLKIRNKGKYLGDPKKIIYRSSYEKKFYSECDMDEHVIKWSAEPDWLKIRYFSPIDKKWHSYYPDVYCEKMVRKKTEKFIIEIKPSQYLKKPVKPKPKAGTTAVSKASEERYIKQLKNYIIIKTKMQFAKQFAEANGMKYIFITERYIKPQTS